MPKPANSLIAMILSFFVMLFVSSNTGVVNFLINISGYWLIIASGILFFIILLGMVGFKIEDQIADMRYGNYIIVLAVVIIAGLILILLASMGEEIGRWFPSMGFLSSDNFIVIIVLVVVMIALFATYKAKPTKN